MKLLIWSEAFWPYVGGVERFLAQLVRDQRSRGRDILVLTAHGSLDLPDDDDFEGVPVRRVPLYAAFDARQPEALLRVRRAMTDAVASFRPDVVHLNLLGPGSLIMTAAASAASRVVLTVHASLDSLSSAEPDTALGRTLARANRIVGCSETARRRLVTLAPWVADRSVAIPYGLDVPDQCEPVPMGPAPHVLCVGRLIHMKGVDVAIAAVATLRSAWPTLRLVIAGDGPERAALEAQARAAGLEEDQIVTFVGWQSPEALADLMRQSTLVVMPSRREGVEYTEGLGLVALEAAAAGRPVIASRAGGLPDAVVDGETGVLVEPDSPADLARAMQGLLEDPAMAQMLGRQAHARVRREFGWDACATAYNDVFQGVADA